MPPPPIPQRREVTPDVQNEESNPPPIPVRSYRPAGAVATAMVSGQGGSGQERLSSHTAQEGAEEDVEDQEHANNPYDLKATPGSSVTASYPFRGDDNLQQLSFAVGDVIKLKQKEEMWSWGVLERSGKEGWFPHNYVGTTFKPLPGIHEMAAKIRERRERLDAAQAKKDADANPNPAPDGESASDVQVSVPDANSAGEGAAAGSGDASDEAGSLSTDVPRGSQPEADSAAAGTGAVDGAAEAQAGGGLGGGVADANGTQQKEGSGGSSGGVEGGGGRGDRSSTAEATAGAASATSLKAASAEEPQISSAPSLPPFFKAGPAANDAAAVAGPPTTGAVGEASSAEVVDGAQIDGVGFAGQAGTASTGCKCSIM
eukprot:g16611.t1